jgi:hypothetical protein
MPFLQCAVEFILISHATVSRLPLGDVTPIGEGSFPGSLPLPPYVCMYSHCMFMYLHRASWHSSATLTEGFPCFLLSCKANTKVQHAKMGHGPHYSKIFVLFYVLFVLCRSMYFLCADVYCTTATRWLPNCS